MAGLQPTLTQEYNCPFCEFTTLFLTDALNHIILCEENGNKHVFCSHENCKHIYGGEEYKVHAQRHLLKSENRNKLPFSCKDCDLTFLTQESKILHETACGKGKPEVTSFMYTCPVSKCHATAFNRELMVDHYIIDHGKNLPDNPAIVYDPTQFINKLGQLGKNTLHRCFCCGKNYFCRIACHCHCMDCVNGNSY